MPLLVLRESLTNAERAWFAPKGTITSEGLIAIPCDSAVMIDLMVMQARYRDVQGNLVALTIPMAHVLACVERADEMQQRHLGFHEPAAATGSQAPGAPPTKAK